MSHFSWLMQVSGVDALYRFVDGGGRAEFVSREPSLRGVGARLNKREPDGVLSPVTGCSRQRDTFERVRRTRSEVDVEAVQCMNPDASALYERNCMQRADFGVGSFALTALGSTASSGYGVG